MKGGTSRPVGRTKPLPGSQVSPGLNGAGEGFFVVVPFLTRRGWSHGIGSCSDCTVFAALLIMFSANEPTRAGEVVDLSSKYWCQ